MQPASGTPSVASAAAFRRLRDEVLDEARRDHERRVANFERAAADRQAAAADARQLLLSSGIDRAALSDFEVAEGRRLDAFLREARPGLADAQRDVGEHVEARVAATPTMDVVGNTATLVGAEVQRADEGTPTWVWLYDADKVDDLTSVQSGDGWGCFVEENPDFPDPEVAWWYHWRPPANGTYSFYAFLRYSGFFIIRANDSWHNCKYAKAHAFARIQVYQDFWRQPHERTIVDRRGSTIDDISQVSGSVNWSFPEPLVAQNDLWIRITATLDTYAQGGGSHAELNFAAGIHELGPPGVFVSRD